MSEALDRAATELANRFRIEPSDDLSEYRDAARAVLLFIRDQTPEMKEAMRNCARKCGLSVNPFVCEAMFKAAIDEFLK